MTKHPGLTGRAGLSLVATLFVSFPAAAFQRSRVEQNHSMSDPANSSSDSFSAPEIELALISSAVLVAGGAALILRDRRARRKLDEPA